MLEFMGQLPSFELDQAERSAWVDYVTRQRHRISCQRRAAAPLFMTTPLVSSEMVDVGVRVLRESGFLWGESSADHLLVRELLEKALSCHPMRTASSQEQSIPVKIEEKGRKWL